MKCKCNQCGNDFDPVKCQCIQADASGIKCPHCDSFFPAFRETKELQSARSLLDKQLSRLNGSARKKAIERFKKTFDAIQRGA